MSLAVTGGSTLWFLSRATGIVAFILLTVTVVLGIVTSLRWQSRNVPRFVIEYVHRNVTVLVLVFIAIHVATVVLDGFAPIGWIAAVIPFSSPYRPIWLSLGALGLDLMLAVAVTSWLRHRVGYMVWRFLHWSAYAAWLLVLVHALGTGTDTREGWALLVEGVCAGAVIVAVWLRIGAEWEQHTRVRVAALIATVLVPVALAGWLLVGPLAPNWAPARRHSVVGADARFTDPEHSLTPLASPRATRTWTPGPAGLPRVLWGLHHGDDVTLGMHRRLFGPLPLLRAAELVDATAHAGLRGRGGAGFPTATKLRAVADGRRPRVVVANGAEGEPASGKDELLLTRAPHLVLDGLMLAAVALEANQAIIGVERTRPQAVRAVTAAVAERAAAGLDPVSIQVVPVPGRYVAGEESALVHLLNGGEAKPTVVPPRPFERGVGGRPTLVQNVETLVHLALIARHGPEWFRTVGTVDQPGSTLLTVGGAVARPSVFEVAFGSRFDSLITAAGGETEPVSAYLIGGYFGTWVRRTDVWGRRLSARDLQLIGASLGAGVITALPQSVCGLVETARVMRYLSEESAGQCGSCVHGLAAIADRVDTVARGRSTLVMRDELDRWSAMVEGRGACRLPDGAVRFLRSALRTFAEEVVSHAEGRCSATRREVLLPIPHVGRDWSWQ